MSNRKLITSLVILTSSLLGSTALLANSAHDNKLALAVKSMIAVEKDLPAADISVSCNDDVIRLSGVVDTQLQLNKAVELAQSVDGVRSVDDNDLKIRDSSNYLRDALITAKAKGKIRQLANQKRIGDNYELHVETTNGVVHIFGKVAKNKDKAIIKDNIAKMDDVKQVHFNIGQG
jgi:hyperosmotically inducible protein